MNEPEIRRVAPGKPGIELAQEREDGMAKVMNEEQREKQREYQRAYQERKRAAKNAQGGGSVKKRAAAAAPASLRLARPRSPRCGFR